MLQALQRISAMPKNGFLAGQAKLSTEDLSRQMSKDFEETRLMNTQVVRALRQQQQQLGATMEMFAADLASISANVAMLCNQTSTRRTSEQMAQRFVAANARAEAGMELAPENGTPSMVRAVSDDVQPDEAMRKDTRRRLVSFDAENGEAEKAAEADAIATRMSRTLERMSLAPDDYAGVSEGEEGEEQAIEGQGGQGGQPGWGDF
jgi:hypothetical protein